MRIGLADDHHTRASRLEIGHARAGLRRVTGGRLNLHRDNPGLRQLPSLKSVRSINELLAPAFRAPQLHGKSPVRSLCHPIFIGHTCQYGPLRSGPPVCTELNDRHSRAANIWEDVRAIFWGVPAFASGQLPQHRPLKPLPPACLELRFCGLKGRRASIAAQAERLSQDAIQRPGPPQGLSAIAKLMDPTHRPFAAENGVIDTDFVDRRDEVCLMIGQRHRFALTLCCASSGSPRPA